MENDKKTSFSTISSGYNSSGTTINYSMSFQNDSSQNENSSLKIDKNLEISSIVNNFEKEILQRKSANVENKGFTSYVTGGNLSKQKYEAHLSDLSDSSDNSDTVSNKPSRTDLLNKSSFEPIATEKLSAPFVHDEKLVQDVLSKAGPANTYQRLEYKNDIGSLFNELSESENIHGKKDIVNEYDENGKMINSEKPTFSTCSTINQDTSPIRIVKPNNQQNVVYKQQVNIRYLQPPTPPPPAPIIIREKQAPAPPKQPPIIIRQTEPAPSTPAPLIIRERAPTPPSPTEPTIIERPLPAAPPQPRQVIIERVPAPPPKPRQIIYEKWLPYKTINRPIIVQKLKQQPQPEAPKNIIIEYEKMNAVSVRTVLEEGVFRVDPTTYTNLIGTNEGNSEIRYVDRITDLPVEHSRILEQLKLEPSNNLSSSNIKYLNSASSYNPLESSSYEHESYNNFLQQFLNLPSENEGASQYLKVSSGNNSYNQNSEYETITTSVPESLAKKIIAEAQAAGAISRSTQF